MPCTVTQRSLQNSCQKCWHIEVAQSYFYIYLKLVCVQNYLFIKQHNILYIINFTIANCYHKNCMISVTSSSHETEARVSGSSNGEEDLWSLWGRIVTNWETEWKRRNQFVRDLVRQGVPHHFRGIVWQLLAGVDCSPEKKLYASYIKVHFF